MPWTWVVFAIVVVGSLGALKLADWVMLKRPKLTLEQRLPRQILMIALTVVVLIVIVLAVPADAKGGISDGTRGQLISLIGIAVAAVITLSSTTLAANAMAGIMLRATAPFRGGDWVRVGEYFGRVTERGLFHTEIQTEDRDLMSVPNLFLATTPMKIVQKAGTIITAEVSLGYSVRHDEAERILISAAREAGLNEPFVWVIDLLDHVVVYRVAGLLEDVSGLMSKRSRLRENMLDALHDAGVEIASPSLVNQRRGDRGDVEMPEGRRSQWLARQKAMEEPVEARVFDKAEEVAKRTELEERRDEITARLDELAELEEAGELEKQEEASLRGELAGVEQRLEEEGDGNGEKAGA